MVSFIKKGPISFELWRVEVDKIFNGLMQDKHSQKWNVTGNVHFTWFLVLSKRDSNPGESLYDPICCKTRVTLGFTVGICVY